MSEENKITLDARPFEVALKAIRAAMADAWDEGMAYGVNHDMGDWEVAPEPIKNPYRSNA